MANEKLCLDSETTTDNIYQLDKPINGTWKLISFNMTNNMYNVNDTNNKIYFSETVGLGSNDYIVTLNNGFYDINTLKDELTTQMNNVSSGLISITVDDNARKYTFTNTNDFGFTFETNTSNSGRRLIGKNAVDDIQNSSQISDKSVDLNKHKQFYIRISQDDNNDVFSTSYFNTSLVINGNGSFGDLYTFTAIDNYNQYVKFKYTKKLELIFHDINNNILDLNSDYTIIFEKLY